MSSRLFPRIPFSTASVAALATAILWWLSLQRISLFAFGWIALLPLLYLLNEVPTARARFWIGWRTGVLCFALLNWWILPAIIKGGAIIGATPPMAAALGVLSIGLIGVIHGFGIAMVALLWNPRAKPFVSAPYLLPIFTALLWFVFETVRSSGVLAHNWGALAFSQWSDVAFLQSASFLGQHGLSAICVWFAASLALWLKPEYSARVPGLWRGPLFVFLVLHGWGAARVETWYYDSDALPLGVLLVQTNVSSLRKNVERGESHFDQAERLTRRYLALGEKTNLIVWPETTATLAPRSSHGSRASGLLDKDDWHLAGLLMGAQDFKNGDRILNSATLISLDSDRRISAQNSGKQRVVPFGERAPFGEYLPLLNRLAPNPPVQPAKNVKTLKLNGTSLGTLICFESCFPNPAKNLKVQGAEVLFVLTNDEWFAGTTAPWEHAAMSTLRAVENGVPVVQCANGGYSFVIDSLGRFQQISEYGRAQVLAASLRLR